jgi:ribosomal subunit interface protein
MITEISFVREEVDQDWKDWATATLSQLPETFGRIESIEVVVETARLDHHDGHKVTIHVNTEHEHDKLVLHEENDDLSHTFLTAVQKMKRKLRKYKERIQKHR